MLAVDPVCRTEIRTEDTKYITEYQGQVYYFESPQCMHAFEQSPSAFVPSLERKVYDEHGDRYDGSE